MKHLISLLALTVIFFSCSGPKTGPAILTISANEDGTFQATTSDSTYAIEIKNGKFIDTVKNANQYYYLVTGQYELSLFVESGDNIQIHIDTKKGMEGVSFTGKGADKQSYLLDKQLKIIAYGKKMDSWYNESGDVFKKNIQNMVDELQGMLASTKLSSEFTEIEKKSIELFQFNLLSSYPSYHEFLTGKKVPESSDYIPATFKNFDFNNEKDYHLYREYKDIALNHYMTLFYKNIEKTYPVVGKEALDFLKDIKIKALKNEIVEQCAYFMSSSSDKLQEFYDVLIANSDNDDFKRVTTKRFDILKNLTKGKKSPSFAYSQPNGNILKLEDLRGKYVYIDVWATWCNPCLKEIPALKALEEKMKDKNIAFVSISIDSQQDKAKWESFIKENALQGYQLFADNSFNSFFVKQYGIDAIPRFILIDKEGNIISADAPKPSSANIEDFLNKNIQ